MPIDLSDADHDGLDATLTRILTAYRDGNCDLSEARAALAHMICALAIGNEQEFRVWLEPGPVGRWLETTDAARNAQAFARRAGRRPPHPTC